MKIFSINFKFINDLNHLINKITFKRFIREAKIDILCSDAVITASLNRIPSQHPFLSTHAQLNL